MTLQIKPEAFSFGALIGTAVIDRRTGGRASEMAQEAARYQTQGDAHHTSGRPADASRCWHRAHKLREAAEEMNDE